MMTSFSDACTSLAGVAGQLKWIASDNKIKWCNGSAWIDATNSVVASCAGTASDTIRYVSNEMRYCNGTNWMSMQGASGTTSGGAQAGRLAFDSTVSKYKFCNGSSCYVMETVASFNEINTPFGGLGLTDVNSLADVTYSGEQSRVREYRRIRQRP